jgi:hypothetical protein
MSRKLKNMFSGPLNESYDAERWRPHVLRAIRTHVGNIGQDDFHSVIPFDAGLELGGAPDLVSVEFPKGNSHVAYITSDLIGRKQVPNRLGNYELMICLPPNLTAGFAIQTLAPLAYYSLTEALEPGETSDISEMLPSDSTLAGLLFFDYARFQILNRACGILLCIGITGDEMRHCHTQKGVAELSLLLKESGTYPVTNLLRSSLL